MLHSNGVALRCEVKALPAVSMRDHDGHELLQGSTGGARVSSFRLNGGDIERMALGPLEELANGNSVDVDGCPTCRRIADNLVPKGGD